LLVGARSYLMGTSRPAVAGNDAQQSNAAHAAKARETDSAIRVWATSLKDTGYDPAACTAAIASGAVSMHSWIRRVSTRARFRRIGVRNRCILRAASGTGSELR
jgi:hypothetical protein